MDQEIARKTVTMGIGPFNDTELKVGQHLAPFFKAVVEEVARHVPEKGYQYLEAGYSKAFARGAEIRASDYRKDLALDNPNHGEALDAAAFLAFSWLHETGKIREGL